MSYSHKRNITCFSRDSQSCYSWQCYTLHKNKRKYITMELEISVWVLPKQSILHLNMILIHLLIFRMSCMSTVLKTFLAILPKFRYSCVLPITLYCINFITSYFVIIIFILVCVCMNTNMYMEILCPEYIYCCS